MNFLAVLPLLEFSLEAQEGSDLARPKQHLNNKEAYDRIRLFIVSPYDSTITQMT